jgi:chromosome segregation ATPase
VLQVDGAASNNQLQDLILQRKALATQQAEILAQLDNPSSDTGSSGSLVEQIAAAEAQAASIQAAIAARGQWAAELEAKQQQLQQQDAQCEMLQRRVTDKQREAVTLKADLAAVRSSRDAAATLLQQAQDASMQAAAAAATVQQQQELLTTKQQEAQHAGSRVQFLQQQWQAMGSPRDSTADNAKHQTSSSKELTASVLTTAAEASCAVAAATAAAAAAAAAAGHQTQHLQGLQQQYMRLQVQAQATERPLTPAATASLLAQQGSSCRTVPLHATFRLKDPEAAGLNSDQLEQLLTPLSVIAGPAVLQTLVASTVTEANRLLAAAAAAAAGTAGGGRGAAGGTGSSKKLKIWPLDHLSVQDFQQRQRAAQQQLGQQAVMLPLDLLKFDGLYRPALLRAFGGLLIAADDATAAVLVERFGLSAVTLQVGGAVVLNSAPLSHSCWCCCLCCNCQQGSFSVA